MPRKKWKLKVEGCNAFDPNYELMTLLPACLKWWTMQTRPELQLIYQAIKIKCQWWSICNVSGRGRDGDVWKLKTGEKKKVQYMHLKIDYEEKYAYCSSINIYKKHQCCTRYDLGSIIIKFQSSIFFFLKGPTLIQQTVKFASHKPWNVIKPLKSCRC